MSLRAATLEGTGRSGLRIRAWARRVDGRLRAVRSGFAEYIGAGESNLAEFIVYSGSAAM
jgi:hypothetical protein